MWTAVSIDITDILINKFCNELNQFDKNVLFINQEVTSEV